MAGGMTRAALVVGASVAIVFAACGRAGPDHVLAQVGGESVTLADFEIYLARNLLRDRDLDARDESYERMMSRLLDRFLEQEVLHREALRRGVEVEDAEFEFYLTEFYSVEGEEDAADAPLDESSRARLREGIRVQKLRDRLLQQPVEEDEAAIRAYLRAHEDTLRPKMKWVLQSLSFDDADRAEEVYSRIRAGRMTFSEAVVFYGDEEDGLEPVRLEPENLPPPVREAVDRLRTGGTASPQKMATRWYLFHLVKRIDREEAGEAALYARAKRAWTEERRREMLDAEVARLVEAAEVRIYEKTLPFRYRPPESPAPAPLAGEEGGS